MNSILSFRRSSQMLQIIAIFLALSPSLSKAAVAQPDDCINQVPPTVITRAWEAIGEYFASLVKNPEQRNKAQLIRLRSNIVQLESEKQQLLDVIEAHERDGASGQVVGQDLALRQIPQILEQISQISTTLKTMAQDANLFAAESAFRQLVLSLDARKTSILCSISDEATAGLVNKNAVKQLTAKLREELKAITAAEDTLAAYIRKLR